MPNDVLTGNPNLAFGYALPHMIISQSEIRSESDQKMTLDDIWIMPNNVLMGNPNLAFMVGCTATHDHWPTRINDIGPCAWLVVDHDHFYFWPIHNIQDTANPFYTLGPSVTYRTSANPFQTLSPSPIEFRSHEKYTPFMCRPDHSNMLAQMIPKSRPTHYFKSQLGSAGLLLSGKYTTVLDHFKQG